MRSNQLLLSSMLIAQALSANAIEITDYDNPVSDYTDAKVSFQVNANDGNQDQSSYDMTFIGDVLHNHSSDDFVWQVDSQLSINANRGSSDGDSTEQGYDSFSNAFINKYFSDNEKVYWFSDATLGLRKRQGLNDSDDPFFKVGAGIGYGRVINATPMAEAIRVVEELAEAGVLKAQPSDAAIKEIAQIISREDVYKSRHSGNAFRKYWFEAIEQVLLNEGVLKGDAIGTVGTIAMNDTLMDERISVRKYGWKVQAGVGYVVSNYDDSDSDPSLDMLFEFAYPFSNSLQLTETFTTSAILDDDTDYSIINALSLTFEVSDTLDWENGWRYSNFLSGESNAEDIRVNSAYSTFSFEVNSDLDLDITLLMNHTDDGIDNDNEKVEKSLFFGLTHEFM